MWDGKVWENPWFWLVKNEDSRDELGWYLSRSLCFIGAIEKSKIGKIHPLQPFLRDYEGLVVNVKRGASTLEGQYW